MIGTAPTPIVDPAPLLEYGGIGLAALVVLVGSLLAWKVLSVVFDLQRANTAALATLTQAIHEHRKADTEFHRELLARLGDQTAALGSLKDRLSANHPGFGG